MGKKYNTIYLPTRPQVDTIVGIFLLKVFGGDKYPGIEDAVVEVLSDLPEGETVESLEGKGSMLVDLGGSRFDHHGGGSTASALIAEDLGMSEDPALGKLLAFVERDDKYGKGIISDDSLDRAFGLPGFISALNKSLPREPNKIVGYVVPLLWGHYMEEHQRTKELPREFAESEERGEAEQLKVRHKGKNVTVVVIQSNNPSMPGWLRSREGVRADVVVQKSDAGYVSILTRPTKRIDLRLVAALLKQEEVRVGDRALRLSMRELMRGGRTEGIPEWYYDTATNSVLNGGINPKGVSSTAISLDKVKELVERGLVELEVRRGRVR